MVTEIHTENSLEITEHSCYITQKKTWRKLEDLRNIRSACVTDTRRNPPTGIWGCVFPSLFGSSLSLLFACPQMLPFPLGTVEFSVRSPRNFLSRPYFSTPVMEGRGTHLVSLSRICQVSPPKVFTNQPMTRTYISVCLLFPCLMLFVVETRRDLKLERRWKLHLHLRGAGDVPSPAVPLGVCSLWMVFVTSTRFCPCLASPCWAYTSQHNNGLSRGCRFTSVGVGTPGRGVPQFLREICCCSDASIPCSTPKTWATC